MIHLLLPKLRATSSFLLIFVCIISLQAQDIIPPSPEAGSLLKYANTPVNLYTGTPEINLPLVEVKGRKITVPVSISYHASGIKVQDIAGSVGLGWTLNAGGVITRTVRGLPDESAEGYCGANQRGNELNQVDPLNYTPQYLHAVGTDIWDGEPDIFYFNVQGKTGRFVLNAEGEPILFPYQDIKIKPGIGPQAGGGSWEIITEDGTTFFFGLDGNSKEETEYTTRKLDGSQKTQSHISSWYLSKIKTPNNEETVSFSYKIGADVSYTYYRKVEIKELSMEGDCDGGLGTELKDLNTNITVKASKYLEQIITANGKVSFSYGVNRFDLNNGLALSEVTLENQLGNVVKKAGLEYSYFSNDGSSRLRLDKIVDKTSVNGPILYNFSYYITYLLPSRSSPDYDHWGYHNNADSDSHIPRFDNENGTYYDGASREPHIERTKANTLETITYGTGGFTRFSYEAHTYLDEQGAEKKAGGIRIKEIKQYETSGILSLFTKYQYTSNQTKSGVPIHGFKSYKNENGGQCAVHILTRFSQSMNQLFDLAGSHIGYANVKEELADGSTILRTYTDHNDEKTTVYMSSQIMFPTSNGPFPRQNSGALGPNYSPFPSSTYKGWQRGQIKETTYKNSNNKVLKREIFEYEFNTNIRAAIKGLVVEEFYYDDDYSEVYPNHYFNFGQYQVISQPYFLDSKVVEQYNLGDETKKIVTTTEYQYDPDYLQLKQVKQTDSEGTEWTTKFSHITDYYDVLSESLNAAGNHAYWHSNNSKETLALLGMLASHQHSVVLEKIVSRKRASDAQSSVISAELMLYQWPPSDPLSARPYQSLQLATDQPLSDFNPLVVTKTGEDLYTITYDNRYIPLTTWDKYDENSNVLQQKGGDEVPVSYLYSYENSLPMAQAINAYHSQIAYTSFEAPDEGIPFISPDKDGNFEWEHDDNQFHAEGYTGNQSFNGEIERKDLPPGQYILTLWAKQKSGSSSTNITVNGSNTKTAGTDWKYLEWSLTFTSSSDLIIHTNGNVIDEVRLIPVGAHMTTFTYDPLIGITSQTDENNLTTHYGYDDFNRLKLVKDQHKDIRQRYKYQYKTVSSGQ